MSVDTKTYIIEYTDIDDCMTYDFFLGEDAYEAVENFRARHDAKEKIQNVALVLDLDESIYE